MKRLLKGVVNFYNTWFGIINLILGLVLLSYVSDTYIMIGLIVFTGIDLIRWYKGVFKNFGTKSELFATIKQNNTLCIVGGIGSGKSTLAQFVLNKFIPKEKQYYNTKNPGFKAFTNKHLLLDEKLEPGCGVLVDEAGAQVDSFHYGKDDAQTRKRIELLNKFFRQWYGSNSLLIYVDQAQGNMNTSLYKNIYYYIQCKSIEQKSSCLVANWVCSLFLYWINKRRAYNKKINNPFTNVHLTYMEFVLLGDYAEHYSVNIDDKEMKKLVCPIYNMFGSLDTYVFREFNPAKEVPPYIWGTNKEKDSLLMEQNFDLKSLKDKIESSFLK